MSANPLEHLIIVTARALYANFSITMVEIGIHLFMALYGLSVILETPESQRKGRKRYIAASFVITALRAFSGSLDMANYFQLIFKSTSPENWLERLPNFNEDWKFMGSYVCLGLVIILGDALLVYRCYIICMDYWWVTILPITTSLSALVLFFLSIRQEDQKIQFAESSASAFLTVSTNIIVTSFITFHLLRARRNLEKLMPSADVRHYTGVIAILIESAAPLTAFGIVAAILQQLGGSSIPITPGFKVAIFVFQGIFVSFCGLSPHMIIFRVTTGRSFTRLPTAKDSVVSNPLQFAHQTAESSFLQSTLNREFGRNLERDAERGSVSDGSPEAEEIVYIAQEKPVGSGDVEKA